MNLCDILLETGKCTALDRGSVRHQRCATMLCICLAVLLLYDRYVYYCFPNKQKKIKFFTRFIALMDY